MQRKIYYLDNNATTQVAPEVVEAMLPFLQDHWGNPSSAYRFGYELSKAIDMARQQVAALIQAEPKELVFTSCGTESNNAALHSALATNPGKRHVVTTAVEHSANLSYSRYLERNGFEVTYLSVSPSGELDLKVLEKSIRPDTAIVSVMWANNETGVIFPINEISSICRSKGVLCHTDAVQAPGKVPMDVKSLGVDFLSMSGHKLHAPKGIGLLYIKRRTHFQPYLMGGHQERSRRGGTENVASMVAFGKAAELALSRLGDENSRVRALRDRLEDTILGTIPDTTCNGAKEPRLPNTSNISFGSVDAEAVLVLLDQLGICASLGSACTTGSLDPSHVLTAMGLSPERARGSVRFSLGYYNTAEDVEWVLRHLGEIILKLRAISPLYSASHAGREADRASS